MYNACTELFLSQYFLLETVFGKCFLDKKKFFFEHGKSFGIQSTELDALIESVENHNVDSIETEKEYFRYLRIRKYLHMSSMEYNISEEISRVIAIKGNTITQALNAGVKKVSEGTINSICNDILLKVAQGNITAMRLYGIACMEGIAFGINKDEGLKCLEAAASWWDIPSIVFLRHYDKDNRFASIAHFAAATEGTAYTNLTTKKEVEKVDHRRISSADKLLGKAFLSGVLQHEVYLPQYAKLIFNERISISEREKLVFTSGKDQVQSVTDLPLEMSGKGKIPFDFAFLDNISGKREHEKKKIRQNLRNSDLRNHDGYHPICIVSDSHSVLKLYANALNVDNEEVNVAIINAIDYSDQEYDMTQNNVFVKECKEDKINVYYIFCVGNVSEKAIESIRDFLNLDKRHSYRLNCPSITLDFSDVLPICFCDKQNAKHFKGYCDVISVTPMSRDEILEEVNSFLRDRETAYGISCVNIDDELQEKLLDMDIDLVKGVLDRAILCQRDGDNAINLTIENVSEFMRNGRNSFSYGFGGTINGNK